MGVSAPSHASTIISPSIKLRVSARQTSGTGDWNLQKSGLRTRAIWLTFERERLIFQRCKADQALPSAWRKACRKRKATILNAGGGGGLAKKKGGAKGEPGEVGDGLTIALQCCNGQPGSMEISTHKVCYKTETRWTLKSLLQVDTPGKKLLVGIAFAYLGIVLFIPAINVFYQVLACLTSGIFKHEVFQPFIEKQQTSNRRLKSCTPLKMSKYPGGNAFLYQYQKKEVKSGQLSSRRYEDETKYAGIQKWAWTFPVSLDRSRLPASGEFNQMRRSHKFACWINPVVAKGSHSGVCLLKDKRVESGMLGELT